MKKIVRVLLFVVMLTSFLAIPSYAGAKKVPKVTATVLKDYRLPEWSKKPVKVGYGKSKIVADLKNQDQYACSYVEFVAPKAGHYFFHVSNLKNFKTKKAQYLFFSMYDKNHVKLPVQENTTGQYKINNKKLYKKFHKEYVFDEIYKFRFDYDLKKGEKIYLLMWNQIPAIDQAVTFDLDIDTRRHF